MTPLKKTFVLACGFLLTVIVIVTKNLKIHYKSDAEETKIFLLNKEFHNQKKREISKQNYFPNDCECHSLFTINACKETKSNLNTSDHEWTSINKEINRFRSGRPVLLGDILLNIARFIPNPYRVTINGTADTNLSPKDISLLGKGNFVHIKHPNVLPLTIKKIKTFSTCNVHSYSTWDVKKCANLFMDATGSPLKIAFVGDSLERSLMEELVHYTYRDLNLTFYNSTFKLNINEQFLNIKAKLNIPIVGNGLQLRFYWAPYLENRSNSTIVQQQGAIDLLEDWINVPKRDHPIPDILYIGGGLWDALTYFGLESTESAITRMEKIQEILIKLSKRVRIIWHMHSFVKGYAAGLLVPKGSLEMMNQLSWLRLKISNIWMWESLAALSIKEYRDCRYYFKAGLLKYIPKSWGCSDPQHPGAMARSVGMDMIWNLSCNRILGIKTGMCCS